MPCRTPSGIQPLACPAGGSRPLTTGEVALAHGVFGDAIDYTRVSIWRRKFFPFQPRKVTMAPRGHVHFHPQGHSYCDDFSAAPIRRQGHFIHEMTHVWQVQANGQWFLLRNRMPWARYDYSIRPGWMLEDYGLEQQAEIVRHAFLLRAGHPVPGAPPLKQYCTILPFTPFRELALPAGG